MRNFFTQTETNGRDQITNTASVQGYYVSMPGGDPIRVTDEDSVSINCIFADIEKEADKDNVNPGDRIKYTITFKNMSNTEMYNVKIVDDLPSSLYLIDSSIVPAPQSGETLASGISVGSVSPNQEKTLTFSAIVNQSVTNDIVNRAYADFEFRDQSGEFHSASTHITSVTTTVGDDDEVSIEKTADKDYITHDGEEIQFTLTVSNNSRYTIEDVVVTDILPSGLKYLENSTIINNNPPINSNPAGGIYFGTMPRGSIYTVKFSATVDL